MIPLQFKSATRSLGAPKKWDQELDGGCGVLAIEDHIDVQSGLNFMYSLWKPEPEEIAAMLAGGVIRLGICGTSHPVVNLAVLTADDSAGLVTHG